MERGAPSPTQVPGGGGAFRAQPGQRKPGTLGHLRLVRLRPICFRVAPRAGPELNLHVSRQTQWHTSVKVVLGCLLVRRKMWAAETVVTEPWAESLRHLRETSGPSDKNLSDLSGATVTGAWRRKLHRVGSYLDAQGQKDCASLEAQGDCGTTASRESLHDLLFPGEK